jgi:hypothetical protein
MHHSTDTINDNFDFYGLDDSAPTTWNEWFDGATKDADGRAVLRVAAVGLIAAGVALLLASRKEPESQMAS